MDLRKIISLYQRDQNIKAPAFEDFATICRVCLNEITEPDTCKNIYDAESKTKIKTLLEIYAYAKIPEADVSLPQNVCSDCVDFLLEIHIFRILFKMNEDLLIKIRKEATERDDRILVQHSSSKNYSQINDEEMELNKCRDCNLVFSDKNELDVHRKEVKHFPPPRKPCPYCTKMIITSGLADHIRTHTKVKPFVCELCNASFGRKSNLTRHLKIHNAKRKKTHTNVHYPVNNVENDVVCPECQEVFCNDKQLKIHIKTRHNKQFWCTICGNGFTTKFNLKVHVRLHTGEKPFVCLICIRSFAAASNFRWHMNIHNGIKAHKCEQCNRQFIRSTDLRKHLKIHNRVRTYKCEQCDQQFSQASHLRSHMHLHKGKQHKCVICNKGFSKFFDLKRHLRNHNTVMKEKRQCRTGEAERER